MFLSLCRWIPSPQQQQPQMKQARVINVFSLREYQGLFDQKTLPWRSSNKTKQKGMWFLLRVLGHLSVYCLEFERYFSRKYLEEILWISEKVLTSIGKRLL